MTSGPSCVLALSKSENSEDVINNWRDDIGSVDNPESFRAQYATDKLMNAIHGSDSHESAMK
jgi:nucleoside diphosphate kinase